MRKQDWIWQCEHEGCGHKWIAVGVCVPVQCPKCRKRHWHTRTAEVAHKVERLPSKQEATGSSPVLRSTQIIDNILPLAAKAFEGVKMSPAIAIDDPEPIEEDLCGFQAHNEIDGEDYICGRPTHGPKQQHGGWIRI